MLKEPVNDSFAELPLVVLVVHLQNLLERGRVNDVGVAKDIRTILIIILRDTISTSNRGRNERRVHHTRSSVFFAGVGAMVG